MLMANIFILLALFCYGIQPVSLKNLFVSHHGHDKENCGDETLPCRSLRHTITIARDNDVIRIDYAGGKPYKECENFTQKRLDTIVLNKSLLFYGFNGNAVLHCQQSYSFFRINSLANASSKVVFSNLSIASRGDVLDVNVTSGIISDSHIRSRQYPLQVRCSNMVVRLLGSAFFSCPLLLRSGTASEEKIFNILIDNCNFTQAQTIATSSVIIISPLIDICDVRITNSVFVNVYSLYQALVIDSGDSSLPTKASIVLDRLRFENIGCNQGVVYISLPAYPNETLRISISNSLFVNTSTRALWSNIVKRSTQNIEPFPTSAPHSVKVVNTTFIATLSTPTKKDGPIYLSGSGFYSFLSCHFSHSVPERNPDFPLIRIESSITATFENCSYEIHRIGRNSGSNLFYIISHDAQNTYLTVKEPVRIVCPKGYVMNSKTTECYNSWKTISCFLFQMFCEECPTKTYSLAQGKFKDNVTKYVKCHECPVGGNCIDGQIKSKPNFWGYIHDRSNWTVKFLQCPTKYCCGTQDCQDYHSCHGNRTGTLCGECPEGMSETLFDTKCKANKHCTGASFWPGITLYLIIYLLFFLYQEDILGFLGGRIFPRLPCLLSVTHRNDQTFKPGGLLKITFYYYQIVYLLRRSLGFDDKINLLDDLETFFFSFLIAGIPSFNCPFQDLRAVEKAFIVHSVGYSLLILLCLLWLSILLFKSFQKLRLFRPRNTETLSHNHGLERKCFLSRIAGAFANISLLMYASSTQLCLSLLHCVPVGERQVMFLDGNKECYQKFQYFLLIYLITCILPFCLVPVLGSYLLKLNRISVAQFLLACIIPLPACFYWSYLLLRQFPRRTEAKKNGARNKEVDMIQDDTPVRENREENVDRALDSEHESRGSKSAILRVLLGPFRPHKATLIFPASHLPWEGFLIFRRLAVILILTFVYENREKAIYSLIVCVAILLTQVWVKPFRSKVDNVLETLSLGTLIVIAALRLIESIYNGEDLDSDSVSFLHLINLIENILIIFPIASLLFLPMLSIIFKVMHLFSFLFYAFTARLARVNGFPYTPSNESTIEENESLLSSKEQ
ncbi:uncharacterized protein LOC114530670 isoform X2 [Dendronephthya gigantea]|uniref:uncharacterized protein LOC114530670 isoform X2 n=1 Tax=Dendronephthya gigantea TaxID=151771 RepID=UPI00106D388C|nr:uncharacterized protein LOC114530670 isoform X2 [Dendronephthya gigantea]